MGVRRLRFRHRRVLLSQRGGLHETGATPTLPFRTQFLPYLMNKPPVARRTWVKVKETVDQGADTGFRHPHATAMQFTSEPTNGRSPEVNGLIESFVGMEAEVELTEAVLEFSD